MACPECYRTFSEEIRFCGLCGVGLTERTVTEPLAAMNLEDELPSDSSYLGTLIDGRYRINRLIGRGGMGSVYEVDQIHMQKTLAMKVLHEDMVVRKQLVSRFTREARAVSRLSNEHTVRVYDFGRHKALFFLVMEYLDGDDLEVILSRNGPLEWRRALKILDQVCDSLTEAHGAGIIHRDLKPENIMVLRRPLGADFTKVLDFGLAKIKDSKGDVFSVHSHRDLFGTPFYMSPEQIRSEDIDGRADIYALGCLAFRMLTNQHVYDAPYAFDVLRQHLTAPIPSACRAMPSSQIPARVDRLIWRALAKRPGNRFPDTSAMREEIAGCLADPEGESLVIPGAPLRDEAAVLEITADLEARLQAFEASHQAAEQRMVEPPPAPVPVGILVDEGDHTLADGELGTWDDRDTIEMPITLITDRTLERPLPEDFQIVPPVRKPAPEPEAPQPEAAEPQEAPEEEVRPAVNTLRAPPVLASVRPQLEPVRTPPVTVKRKAPDLAKPLPHIDVIEPVARSSREPALESFEIGYAKELRTRRRLRTAVGLVAAAACVAALAVVYFKSEPTVTGSMEQEPNDHAQQAQLLTPGTPIEGFIGKRRSAFEPDRDMYKVDMGDNGRYLELQLSGIRNMDLFVDVLDTGGRPITRVNYDGTGQPESLHRLRVPGREVILVVSEFKAPELRPTENVSDRYKLLATIKDSLDERGEVEPNDTPAAANAFTAGAQITGYLDGVRDVDYYRVSTDGVMDLRRWEVAVEAEGSLVPRISIFRVMGEEPLEVFSDEGHSGLLRTVYEEPAFPNPEYLLAVSHAGRGDRRGAYKLVADLLPPKPRIAHEPNDDRASATALAIGQEVHGILEGTGDVDVFAIPVTDPGHRLIEIQMDGIVRERVRLAISDVNESHTVEVPPPPPSGRARLPQPMRYNAPIRFEGAGETYYLRVKSMKRRARDVAYSFRVIRVMKNVARPLVGGPGH